MLAYHNNPQIKSDALAAIKAHRDADNLIALIEACEPKAHEKTNRIEMVGGTEASSDE